MLEIENNHKEIEKIEINGNPCEIWGVKSCKTFRNYIQSRINDQIRYHNKEREMMLRTILGVYDKFHPEIPSKVLLENWKSRSSFEIIKKPDYWEVITYEKPDQDSEPKKMTFKIIRYDMECLLKALGRFIGKENVKTKLIAQEYCFVANIRQDNDGRELFENGLFNFRVFFADRSLHLNLNIKLRTLDKLGKIKYRGGKTTILSDLDIQSVFC